MEASEIVFTYTLKAGTQTSYLREPGPGLLPERIGFSSDLFTPIKRTGAAYNHSKLGQVKADFKKTDESLYKSIKAQKPFIHFTLFEIEGWQNTGFANIAYSIESGKIYKTNDLVIARFLNDERSILEIRLYPGRFHFREEIILTLRQKVKRI